MSRVISTSAASRVGRCRLDGVTAVALCQDADAGAGDMHLARGRAWRALVLAPSRQGEYYPAVCLGSI